MLTPLLAQFGSANVPELPPPPMLERLFLESPLVVIVALVLVGAFAAYLLNRSGRPRIGLVAGLAGVALAAVVWLVADRVVTEREVLRVRSRELARAVAEADPRPVGRILAADAQAVTLLSPGGAGLDWILQFVEREMAGPYAVREYDVRHVEATIDGPNVGRTQVHVTVTPELTRVPTQVVVGLDWRKERGEGGEWRVTDLRPLHVSGVRNPAGR